MKSKTRVLKTKCNHISIKCQAATMKLFFFKSKVNGVTKALI